MSIYPCVSKVIEAAFGWNRPVLVNSADENRLATIYYYHTAVRVCAY